MLLRTTFLLLIIALLSAAISLADSGPPNAAVKTQKFDPPAVIDEYNQIVAVVTVTNVAGSPGLVLHIPCIRSSLTSRTLRWGGHQVAPGFVEGCEAQKIPWGKWAGDFVKEDGEIFVPPNGGPGT